MSENDKLMSPKRYERITAQTDDGVNFTYRCEIISETAKILRAHILDREWNRGGKFDPESGAEIFQEWLLDKSLITRRTPMVQDPKYGTWRAVRKAGA